MFVWVCVVLRIVANPCSNVFQKILTQKHAHPLFIVGTTHALLTIVCLPALLFHPPPMSASFWSDMAICTLLTVSGNALLVQAVKLADLSVLGPINAWKSVVSIVPGMLLLSEVPAPLGLAGIALVVAGNYGLSEARPDEPRHLALWRLLADRGVQCRFAALILSATEAVYFKRALVHSSAIAAFAIWAAFGFAVSLAAAAIRLGHGGLRQEVGIWRASWTTYLLLFLTTGVMQFSTAVTLESLPVGSALALFQISTVLSVILGHRLFQEGHFLKRLAGSLVMAAGAVLIILGR